jgi:hypothetical protein
MEKLKVEKQKKLLLPTQTTILTHTKNNYPGDRGVSAGEWEEIFFLQQIFL